MTNRRDFVKASLLQVAAFQLPQMEMNGRSFLTRTSKRDSPSILQGATDSEKTQFSIVHNIQNLKVIALDSTNHVLMPEKIKTHTFEGEDFRSTKVYFSNLSSSEKYQILLVTPSGEIIDRRDFKTLDTDRTRLRFAFCSCMKDSLHEPEIWNDLVQQNPDIIFFIGDAVYADIGAGLEGATPQHLWEKYTDSRRTLEIYFSKKLIPIISVWDDHDFGKNNSDSSYKYREAALKNFKTFFAQDSSHCELIKPGPGVSNVFTWGDHQFVLMDDRSFRKKSGSEDRYAQWGQEQEKWMLNLVRNFSGLTWLINGSQYFPYGYWKESLTRDSAKNLSATLAELKKIKSKVVFVSGDVHYSEVTAVDPALLGYQTYEITSSSMHSICFPGAPLLSSNPGRMASTTKRNYVMVEAERNQLVVTSRNKTVFFSFDLEI